MNKISFVIIFLGALAILTQSCECPSNVGPSIVRPTEYADVAFFDAISGEEGGGLKIVGGAFYLGEIFPFDSQYEYFKVGILNSSRKKILKVYRSISETDSTLIFQNAIDVKKDSVYSCAFFGLKKNPTALFASDYIPDFRKENVYARFGAFAYGAPPLAAEIYNETFRKKIELEYGRFSSIFALPAGEYAIEFRNQDSSFVKTFKNFSVESSNGGEIWNIFLTGFYDKEKPSRAKIRTIKPRKSAK